VLCPVSAPRLRVLRSACRRFVRTHRRYPDGRWGPLAGPLEHGIALPPTLGKFSCRAKPGTNRRRCYAQGDCPLPSVKSRFFCNFLQGGFSFLPLREYHLLSLALLVATSCEELAHVQVAPARQPFLRLFDGQRAHQPEARPPLREDPNHSCAPLELLVEPLQTVSGAVSGADAPAMALREGQARQALLDALFYVLGDPGMPSAPPIGQLGGEPEGHFPVGRGEHPA
jgi:hypothetical protein